MIAPEFTLSEMDAGALVRLGHGHDARSAYVEAFWLPAIGPSALLVLRRFADWIEAGDPATLAVADIAPLFGIREPQMTKTLERLAMFGLVRWADYGRLEVRVVLPPLPARHIERLPAALREAALARG